MRNSYQRQHDMRVTHDNIEDLLTDLRTEKDSIYLSVVRMQTYRMDEFEGDPNKARTSYIMGLSISALVRHDDGDWCIEFSEMAGKDTTKNPDDGSDAVDEWRQRVIRLCDACGLTVRPGKWEVI